MKNNYNLTKHFYRYTYNTKTLKSQKKKNSSQKRNVKLKYSSQIELASCLKESMTTRMKVKCKHIFRTFLTKQK